MVKGEGGKDEEGTEDGALEEVEMDAWLKKGKV